MKSDKNNGIRRWKRALDVVAILLAMPMLVPLSLAIAAVIRATSTGPFLFQQERVGYRGRRFMCLKFRTMYCDAAPAIHQGHLKNLMASDAPMVKMDAGDSRIIPASRLLRASRLVELLKLITILKEEVSLVGPRPCLP